MGRNYFELANDCLEEMYWSTVPTFEELANVPEGRKIKNYLNRCLLELCDSEQDIWTFREKEKKIIISSGKKDYSMVNGFITSIRINDGSQRPALRYLHNHDIYTKDISGTPDTYYIYNNKIILHPTPVSGDNKDEYIIEYLTNDFAIDKDGISKPKLELEKDEPIIPEKYRDILIYGVCRELRGSNDDRSAKLNKKYLDIYRNMCYNLRRTDDYIKGNKLCPINRSSLYYKVQAFNNPYSIGK